MTTPLDPKKIEEYRDLAAMVAQTYRDEPGAEEERLATEVVPALLGEREEMQREIEALRAGAPVKAYARSDEALRDVSATCLAWEDRAKKAEATAGEALALLREVEWGGRIGPEGEIPACPSCWGAEPEAFDREGVELTDLEFPPDERTHRGHTPDCRLDALLAPGR